MPATTATDPRRLHRRPHAALDARTGLDKLATYPYQIATWVDDAGYPVSVAVEATIDPTDLTATFDAPAGLDVPTVPTDRPVSLTGSHIRPQPGYGYDERRHVTVWGPVSRDRRLRSTADAPARPGAGTRPRSRSSSTRSARSASRAATSTPSRRSAARRSSRSCRSGS